MISAAQYKMRTKKFRKLDSPNCTWIVEKTKSGSWRAFWLFRYQIEGKNRELTFLPETLHSDRQKAQEWRNQLAKGIDPKEGNLRAERQRKRKALTFREVALAALAVKAKNSSQHRWAAKPLRALENHVFPIIGDIAIANLDRDDVLSLIEPLWYSMNPTAQKLLTYLSWAFGYAISEGIYSAANPTTWKGNLEYKLPQANKVHAKKHQPAMDYEELPTFFSKLSKNDSLTARFIQFCILTGIRNGTVRVMKWADLDMKTLVWHIPKTKNGKPFSVPLTPQMLQILKAVKSANNSPYVFHQKRDTNKPLSENAGTVHLKKVWGFNTGEITMHGFRSTFSTYMNDLPELNPRIIDACIEHQMGDPIEQSYNRSGWLNKRRHYMEIWNDYCASLLNT